MLLPKDVYEYITNFADNETILKMLSVNKKFNSEEFFVRVMRRKYPLLIKYKYSSETMKDYFIRASQKLKEAENKYGIPYIPHEGYNLDIDYSLDNYLEFAAELGDMRLVHLCLAKGAKETTMAAVAAASKGHIDIVKLMLDTGCWDYQNIIHQASSNGHIEIVKFMLDKGVKFFNRYMISAGKGGHIEIVQLFLDRGANDFNSCAEEASLKGHLNIVKLMLDRGATNLDAMFLGASSIGSVDIVKFLLGRGFLYGLKPAIKCAAFCGHLEVVRLIMDAGFPVSDITSVILSATIGGRDEVVRYLTQIKNE